MINRNRNSAVARAQAEMKQAVNSSRRQLNCGRDEFRKGWDAIWPSASEEQAVKSDVQTILRKYRKPTDDMPDIYMLFDRASASDKQTVIDMLNENPQIDSFNSSRRPLDSASANRPAITNSARHMSYKTRKAVEYSINCARRRARLNCGWKMYPTAETAVVPAEMMRVSATNNYIPADDIVLTATADNKAIEITCGDIHNIIKIVPQEESMYNAVYKINGRSITAINGAKGLVGSIDQAVNGENNGVNINLLMYCMLYNFAPDWKAEYDHRYDK